MSEKKSLLQKIKADGPKDVALEAVKHGVTTWVLPFLAPVWIAVTTIAAGLSAYWGTIDPVVRFAAVLLSLGCSIWIARQVRDWFRIANQTVPTSVTKELPAHDEIAVKNAADIFTLTITSGYSSDRTSKFAKEKDEWLGVTVDIVNTSAKTLRNLEFYIDCRTWLRTGALPALGWDDAKTVVASSGLGSARSLHPKSGLQMTVIAQNRNDNAVVLGDPRALFSNIEQGTHFVTITATSDDMEPTYKNLIFFTCDACLYAVEFDSRNWGAPADAPHSFYTSNRVF